MINKDKTEEAKNIQVLVPDFGESFDIEIFKKILMQNSEKYESIEDAIYLKDREIPLDAAAIIHEITGDGSITPETHKHDKTVLSKEFRSVKKAEQTHGKQSTDTTEGKMATGSGEGMSKGEESEPDVTRREHDEMGEGTTERQNKGSTDIAPPQPQETEFVLEEGAIFRTEYQYQTSETSKVTRFGINTQVESFKDEVEKYNKSAKEGIKQDLTKKLSQKHFNLKKIFINENKDKDQKFFIDSFNEEFKTEKELQQLFNRFVKSHKFDEYNEFTTKWQPNTEVVLSEKSSSNSRANTQKYEDISKKVNHLDIEMAVINTAINYLLKEGDHKTVLYRHSCKKFRDNSN